jgi:predicted O-linked N-acetylglucosamine transferase (SPINDLY family)
VSRTPQEYAAKIVELAGNLEKLRHMRRGLRERFAASDAMNAPRFTAHLEAEYQTMWRKWCSEGRGFA